MRTILLFGGSMLLLYSCVGSTEESNENLSDEEMKDRVEMEEIEFEPDSSAVNEGSDSSNIALQDRQAANGHDFIALPDSLPQSHDQITDFEELKVAQGEPFKIPEFSGIIRCFGAIDPNARVFQDAHVDAQYPGGVLELKKFIRENIRYPKEGDCVQGIVYVSFVIETDGSITDAKVVRGVAESLDAEALRLVRSMPHWIPAKNNGKVVAAFVRLPIRFTVN